MDFPPWEFSRAVEPRANCFRPWSSPSPGEFLPWPMLTEELSRVNLVRAWPLECVGAIAVLGEEIEMMRPGREARL